MEREGHHGSRAGREPGEHQPGQRGQESLTSKALSIVWVNLSCRAAPLALEEVVVSRDTEEQGCVTTRMMAHVSASMPAVSLWQLWEFQTKLLTWKLSACYCPCCSGCWLLGVV